MKQNEKNTQNFKEKNNNAKVQKYQKIKKDLNKLRNITYFFLIFPKNEKN